MSYSYTSTLYSFLFCGYKHTISAAYPLSRYYMHDLSTFLMVCELWIEVHHMCSLFTLSHITSTLAFYKPAHMSVLYVWPTYFLYGFKPWIEGTYMCGPSMPSYMMGIVSHLSILITTLCCLVHSISCFRYDQH